MTQEFNESNIPDITYQYHDLLREQDQFTQDDLRLALAGNVRTLRSIYDILVRNNPLPPEELQNLKILQRQALDFISVATGVDSKATIKLERIKLDAQVERNMRQLIEEAKQRDKARVDVQAAEIQRLMELIKNASNPVASFTSDSTGPK